MENQKIQNNEEDNYNFQGKNQTEMTNLKQIPISKKEFSIEDVDDSDDILIEKKDKVEPAKKAASFFQLQYQMSTSCDNIIMIIALLGSLGMGISMPLFSVVFGGSINTFGTVNASGNETFISDISSLCAKFVYVGLGIWASGYIMIWLWGYNGRVIAKRIKERYFELLLSQEQGWYDQQNVNEFSTKIQTQVKTVEIGIGDKIGNSLMAISMTIGSFVVGFTYSWKLSLVLCSVLPVLMIGAFFMVQAIRNSSVRNREAYEKAGGIAEECLKNIKTVASFGNFDYEIDRFNQRIEDSYKSGLQGGLKSGITMGFLFFTIFASYTLAIWYGSRLIADAEINGNTKKPFQAGDVLTVLFTIVFGAFSLGQAAPNIKAITEAMNASYEFFELMKRNVQIKKSPNDVKPEKEQIQGQVRFESVYFSYPTKLENIVLKGLNLTIEEGKVTAIVGTSGSGKSTIASLIERLYELADGKGRILLDSCDISTIDVDYLRSLIGYVPQEPVLFNTSIRDNIIFGRENITDDQIWDACKKALVDEFLTEEEGLDRIVGLKGSKLSGGQKQRVAIARAILTTPKILILDEATSALDNKSEKEVQKSLNKVSKGITTIVIAHRLSTIINADKIVVLKEGIIVEEGNHKSLMEKNNYYSELVRTQVGTMEFNPDLLDNDEAPTTMIASKIENEMNPTLRKPTSTDENKDLIASEEKKISRMPQPKIKRKNSLEELEEQIASEKQKKLDFEKSADQKRAKLLPILKEKICLMVSAAIFASIAGAVWPVYGILLADSIASLSKVDKELVKQEGFMLSMYFLILAGVAGISTFFQNFLFVSIGEHLTKTLRKLTFVRFLRLHMGFYDIKTNTPGYLASQLSSDTTKTNSIALSMVGISVQTISTLIIALTLGFIFEWRLSLINLGLIPLMVGASIFHFKLQQGFSSVDEVVEATAGGILSESVANTKTIYCYNMQAKVVRMYNKMLSNGMKTINKTSFVNGILFGFSQFVMFVTYAIIFYAGGSFMYQGTLQIKEMFRAIFCLLFAGFGLGQAQQYVGNISEAKAALVNVFKTIDEPSKIDPIEIREKNPSAYKPPQFRGEIEFKNVKFKYNEESEEVLKGVSFKIEAGKKVAFVGASGSGKSTVIQLIERFYDVTEGEVLLDGVDIRNYDLEWLRHNISCVLQEPILFQRSNFSNIKYGKLSADKLEVVECAKKAEICELLIKGASINVSGGQKQRLALARAIINNPRILLFDEFTSALNADLEKIILKTLEPMLENRTSITIAHRLSTIENCDIIFVMDSGQIIERGSHNELYEMKGKYYHLYNAGHQEIKKSVQDDTKKSKTLLMVDN